MSNFRYRACSVTPGVQAAKHLNGTTPERPNRQGWIATCPCGWEDWEIYQSTLRERITTHRFGRGADLAGCAVTR